MGDVAKLNTIEQEQNALISVIERVATSPDADIAKLEKMLDLQERVMNRQAKEAFAADMAMMQTKLPRVARNGESHNGMYALLEDINDAIREPMQQHGFAVTFRTKQNGMESVSVTAILSHKSGHSEETEMILPLDKSGNKTLVQSVGSTVSYGKRYTLSALLNISTGDDNDGNNDNPNTKAPTLTPPQIQNIRKALKEANKSEEAFCKTAQISRIEDLPQKRLAGALKAIAGKKS